MPWEELEDVDACLEVTRKRIRKVVDESEGRRITMTKTVNELSNE